MSSMKVCVFGATGFVGSALTNELTQKNIPWIGISRSVESDNVIKATLNDVGLLKEAIAQYPVVINAMGSFKPNDFELNTKHVFQNFWENIQAFSELLSTSQVSQLLHISSGGTVYGENIGSASKETDRLKPISWYGKAKAIEESIFERAALQKGFKYTCARVSNPFGNKSFSNHGFIDVLINTILNGGSFNTFANQNYSRDFIHSKDMAEVILALLQHDQKEITETFNVGTGKSTSLHSVIKMAAKIVNDFQYKLDRLDNDYDVIQNYLDVSKLENLGVKTEKFTSIEDYLNRKLIGRY